MKPPMPIGTPAWFAPRPSARCSTRCSIAAGHIVGDPQHVAALLQPRVLDQLLHLDVRRRVQRILRLVQQQLARRVHQRQRPGQRWIGKRTPGATRNSLALSSMPNHRMTSGLSASAGLMTQRQQAGVQSCLGGAAAAGQQPGQQPRAAAEGQPGQPGQRAAAADGNVLTIALEEIDAVDRWASANTAVEATELRRVPGLDRAIAERCPGATPSAPPPSRTTSWPSSGRSPTPCSISSRSRGG